MGWPPLPTSQLLPDPANPLHTLCRNLALSLGSVASLNPSLPPSQLPARLPGPGLSVRKERGPSAPPTGPQSLVRRKTLQQETASRFSKLSVWRAKVTHCEHKMCSD